MSKHVDRHGDLRAKLEARRVTLAAEMNAKLEDARRALGVKGGDTGVDGGDSASLCTSGEIALAEARRDGEELSDVQAALERLASGTYGLCIACGKAIATKRLLAAPAVSRCTECQSAVELKPV